MKDLSLKAFYAHSLELKSSLKTPIYENRSVRLIPAGTHPDHDCIRAFRRKTSKFSPIPLAFADPTSVPSRIMKNDIGWRLLHNPERLAKFAAVLNVAALLVAFLNYPVMIFGTRIMAKALWRGALWTGAVAGLLLLFSLVCFC